LPVSTNINQSEQRLAIVVAEIDARARQRLAQRKVLLATGVDTRANVWRRRYLCMSS